MYKDLYDDNQGNIDIYHFVASSLGGIEFNEQLFNGGINISFDYLTNYYLFIYLGPGKPGEFASLDFLLRILSENIENVVICENIINILYSLPLIKSK